MSRCTKLNIFVLSTLVPLLAACGGGGGKSSPPTNTSVNSSIASVTATFSSSSQVSSSLAAATSSASSLTVNMSSSLSSNLAASSNSISSLASNVSSASSLAASISSVASSVASSVPVVVIPADKTPPTVSLTGASSISLKQGAIYTEQGATASDLTDGVVTVITTGTVDTSTVGSYTITYTATDKAGNSASVMRTVEVTDGLAPTITLNGASSVQLRQGDIYIEQGAAAVDTLDGVLAVVTAGTVDASKIGTYTIIYSAKDKAGNTGAALRSVSIVENYAPSVSFVASGNQYVGAKQTLTANGSDSNGDALAYQWTLTKPEGSSVTTDGASSGVFSFTPDVAGAYTVMLIASDGLAVSEAKSQVLNVGGPLAHAGEDQYVPPNTLTTLNGSKSISKVPGSLLNYYSLTYKWKIIALPTGSSASLSSASVISPAFTPDIEGDYVVELVVNDSKFNSAPDTVTITATRGNIAPVANAGEDQNVATNSIVNLKGSNSGDINGDGLTYLWSITSKPGVSLTTLDNATVMNPTFRPDVAGSYVLELIVSDGLLSSKIDSVQITAKEPKLIFNGGSLPYSSTNSYSISMLPAPSSFTLEGHLLTAEAQDFTLINVTAVDLFGKVNPSFSGISEGSVIKAGSSVSFSLNSPRTYGYSTQLQFSFTVKETGKTFRVIYNFASN